MNFIFKTASGLTLEKALTLEWLETNGLGGYASSSIINCNTRKYHGLLVANLPSLPDKYVLLDTLEDSVIVDGKESFLTAHQYPDFFQNGSFDCFQEFSCGTHPIFKFKFADFTLTKEILLIDGENTVLVKYKINSANQKVTLKIRPLFASRDFHALAKENTALNSVITSCNNGLQLTYYPNMPPLFLQTAPDCNAVKQELLWYRNFSYLQEQQRGYDFTEDLFTPVSLEFRLSDGEEVIFSCALEEQKERLAIKWQNEITRRNNRDRAMRGSELQRQLQKVGQSFIQRASNGNLSIVAGYHWFLEWGRDAMISLPGLTLYSGLEAECLIILKKFASQEKNGLIPNFLGETPEKNAYNSVDASLWFAWAIQQYYLKTSDLKAIKQHLWPTLRNIFCAYKNGTLHNIKAQSNGLLYAGDKVINLTWMDAVINDHAVTPRCGLQVEVNALWFNCLCFMRSLAAVLLDPIKPELETTIAAIKQSFVKTFWDAELGYLYDFVNSEEKNALLRPNQIFAVSLPYSAVPKKIAIKIIKAVKESLLTPYGLRTLAPSSPGYVGVYAGGNKTRDQAYHNGTVWPWLLGHFAEALLLIANNPQSVAAVLKPCFDALTKHLLEGGIGTIAEVFSGDRPHSPGGCISQAWSAAEILRLTYLLNMRGTP